MSMNVQWFEVVAMMQRTVFALWIGLSWAVLSGCGGDPGSTGLSSLASASAAAADQCPSGGIRVSTGVDKNRNGALDSSEVTATWSVCNGEGGTYGVDGTGIAIRTEPTLPDADCPYGGVKITSGVDSNADGVLDDAEISTANPTKTLCSSVAELFSGLVFLAPGTFAENQELYRVNADGSGLYKVAATQEATQTIPAFQISPDHRWVAYAVGPASGGVTAIYVASLVDDQPIRQLQAVDGVTVTGLNSLLLWAPDSSRLAFSAQGASGWWLYTVLPDGTGRQCINGCSAVEDVYGGNIAWSPDSTSLAYVVTAGYQHHVARADGVGDPVAIGSTCTSVSPTLWAPHSDRVAFWCKSTDWFLYVAEVGDWGVVLGTSAWLSDGSVLAPSIATLAWQPGKGDYLAYLRTDDTLGSPSRRLTVWDFTLAPPAARDITVTNSGTLSWERVTNFVWAPDGNKLAYHVDNATGDYGLYVVTPTDTSGGARRINGNYVDPEASIVFSSGFILWSPNSSAVAYSPRYNEVGDNWLVLQIVGAASGDPVTISNNAVLNDDEHSFAPAWSPDGSRIAYATYKPGVSYRQIFVAGATDATGGTAVTGVDMQVVSETFAWSVDGTNIAYVGWMRSGSAVEQLFTTTLTSAKTVLVSLATPAGSMPTAPVPFSW